MVSMLYEKHNYLNKNISYLKNNIIREYDIVNAGLNILKHHEVISIEDYEYLNSLDKLEKNIAVGKFLKKNPDINEALTNEFIIIRQKLFEMNNIEDQDILSIKKDAIFVINKPLNFLEINSDVRFEEKNKYIAYLNIDGKEFYFDSLNRRFDIKGFPKIIKKQQTDYIFKELAEIVYLDSINDKDSVFERLIQFKYNFIQRNLSDDFYLDMTQGKYLFEYIGSFYTLEQSEMNEELKKLCFIQNNLNFIMRAISIIL